MPLLEWDADLHLLYDDAMSKAAVEKAFVLDGQQRIQTLYTLFAGNVHAGDKKAPEEAYVDVTSGTTVDPSGLLYHLEFSATPLPLPRVHLDLWYAVPPTKGGHQHGNFTVCRHPNSLHRGA
jgi:hypothetical protein